ncbi:MAG: aldehyde dehydrogenase family protein, partial [Verrucomicrobia bacterium]|nr:aldehyde dehydrogenase family protein [Verrucomicrobiota bacterium]
MISEAAAARAEGLIQAAQSEGARVLTGGRRRGAFLEPTLLDNVKASLDICRHEVFAPLAVLQSYRDFDEALAQVNDSDYGLQTGVFTRDIRRAWKAFETLEVGGVLLNNTPTFRVENMPYGGVKASGFGREGIRSAMEEMTEPRSLILKLGST